MSISLKLYLRSRICHVFNLAELLKASFPFSTNAGDGPELRARELSEFFGCSFRTAQELLRRNSKIASVDFEELTNNLKFCRSNFSLKDIIEFPTVVTLPYNVINHRYHMLRELGCERVEARHIVQFLKLMSTTPATLKKDGLLIQQSDTLPCVFQCSEFPEEKSSELRSKILELYMKNCKLSDIAAKMTCEFLMWRLHWSQEKREEMIKKYPQLLLYSINEIDSTINVLTRKYNFSLKEIRKCIFVLTLHSSQLETLIQAVPDILSIPLPVIAKKSPFILKKPPSSLKKMEEVFKELYITSNQILCYPRIFALSPSALKHRFEAILKSNDLASMKHDRYFLHLVYNFKNNLNHRLKLLNASKVPFSMSMLMVSEPVFRKRLRLNKCQNYAKDIVHYLAEFYGYSEKNIRHQLQEYPNVYSSSVISAYKVIDFLLSRGISKEQLWNGLGIIAYKPQTVEQFFNRLPQCEEFRPFSEWIGHFNFVQLLIYAIERNGYCAISQSLVQKAKDDRTDSALADILENDDDDLSSETLHEWRTFSDDDDNEGEIEISDAYII